MASSSRANSPIPSASKGKRGKANLTGFVLKLCEMVHGAPDDVVSWIPSGEAFRISDLARLESETLPQYFRHSRFQSLVRQLNFYNFRKINRERTFWVYYHPMFHRDRPEDMPKLKRRTCPGYDGRKNRPDRVASPPPTAANITWSNEDETVRYEGNEGGAHGMVSSPATGIKVSRSPSPSNSPMDHLPAGRGSLKPVISEEELGAKKPPFTSSDGQNSFHRTVSNDARMNGYDMEPHPADDYVDDHDSHIGASGEKRFTKKSRKAKQTYSTWSDDEDDTSRYSYSGNRKKYSKEELQERQDHRLAVAEVSRHLNEICSDYAASMSEGQPRSRGKGRSGLGGQLPGQATRSASALHAFGFDKPVEAYYGAGKCDLFTYDCEDGFEIDVSNAKASVVTPSKRLKPVKAAPAVASPPSQSPVMTQLLAQACYEGRLVDSSSILERTLASAVFAFCLSHHPQDPDLASKIDVQLNKGPMLAKEFQSYCKALAPGVYPEHGMLGSSEDLKRKWKLFSQNYIKRIALSHRKCEGLSGAENEAIERCVASWVQEV